VAEDVVWNVHFTSHPHVDIFVARTREVPDQGAKQIKMMAVYCISHSSDNTRCQAPGMEQGVGQPTVSAGGQSLARRNRLEQRRQFVEHRHGRPMLVPCIRIAGLGPNRAAASTKDHPL
jgi:hypothetical protein